MLAAGFSFCQASPQSGRRFQKFNAKRHFAKAIPGKVRSGFPFGIA
jgi:hypothetical protein